MTEAFPIFRHQIQVHVDQVTLTAPRFYDFITLFNVAILSHSRMIVNFIQGYIDIDSRINVIRFTIYEDVFRQTR